MISISTLFYTSILICIYTCHCIGKTNVKDNIKSLAQMIPDIMLNNMLKTPNKAAEAVLLPCSTISGLFAFHGGDIKILDSSQNKMFQELCVRLKNVNDRKSPSPREIFE